MHAEPAAMQNIVEALEPLTPAQRQAVARKILLVGDPEILALGQVLTALQDVKGVQARTRVIRWAMDAYKAPKVARAKKAKDEKAKPQEPPKASPVTPVREAAWGA